MTYDELVQSAAQAMHHSECGCVGGESCATWKANHEHMAAALTAAFAALPECEDAVAVLAAHFGGQDWLADPPEDASDALRDLAARFGSPHSLNQR